MAALTVVCAGRPGGQAGLRRLWMLLVNTLPLGSNTLLVVTVLVSVTPTVWMARLSGS